MIRNLLIEFISNPLAAIILLITLVFIISLILKFSKPTQKTIINLEIIWLLVGFMGVLYLINENSVIIHNSQIEKIEQRLKFEQKWLSKNDYGETCYSILGKENEKQTNFGIVSLEYCNWLAENIRLVESISKNGFEESIEMTDFHLAAKENYYSYNKLSNEIKEINDLIVSLIDLKKKPTGRTLNEFKPTVGILILILAFALRISLAIHKREDNKT